MSDLRYIDTVKEDKALVAKLESIYQEMCAIKRFRKRMEEIDNEVGWFVGNESISFLPDYTGYYDYAFKHYVPEESQFMTVEELRKILASKAATDIPGYIYVLLIMAHYQPILEEKFELIKGRMDEAPKAQVAEFHILRNKVKLTAGFLNKIDMLIPRFIHSVED